jgi:4-methyl-5(b-hydroxyethyl)-thiazole monophosphate biosynthesis
MNKRVLLVLADGFEEIEAVTPIDVLRRAGIEVTVAGVGKKDVTGSHGITIQADVVLEKHVGDPDAVILPGGMPGAENLRKSELLKKIIEKAKKSGAWIAAICASPAVVLSPLGILDGKRATCYPGFENQLNSKISFSTDRVVTDGLVITSRGPGTALEFSLEIVNRLAGPEKAAQLASQVIAK